ncbi:MAG: hypothetical protein K2X73_15325 [Sphingomonas sp.]|uniref:hypothetical protein n=1 Tax=Sphingomonas sp. TaxID=28214 RepID=UPI0025F03BAA|nr:hypothetical protein [Sphingomonas sp.]MBX9883322.1 hypothetical protein [Sphingomonas sp.]
MALQGGMLIGQAAGAVAALLVATFAPPARGTLLIVPLGATPAHRLLAVPGVTLRGRGPWPGSLVIEGDGALFWPALGDGLLVVRGSAASCGGKETTGWRVGN